jgi:LysR family transcriptional activator of nhaA
MLNYNHLHYFHVVAEEGSVGAAATRLGVTQPTVSEQLRTLERALGTPLFERLPAGLKLNDAGRIAFEHTSVMFGISSRLVHNLSGGLAEQTRILRIGISGTVSRATSGRFLLPLLTLDCTPVIRLVDCAELMRALKAGTLDLVLCENVPRENDRRGLVVHSVESTQLVAVAHPSLTPAEDWSDVALVQYSTGSRFRWAIDAYLAQRKLRPRIAAEADDAMFLVEAAATAQYVSIVPWTVVRETVAAGRLRVLDTVTTEHAGIHAIYRNTDAQELARQAVAALVDTGSDSQRSVTI